MNKKKIGAVVIAVVIAGVSFYAGVVYGKGSGSARGAFGSQFQGGMPGQFGGGQARGGRMGGGFVAGQVLSKDATSLTVKVQDGSTKLVLLSASTTILKTTPGSLSDLTAGVDVVITGGANQDGSVTAASVQLHPAPRQ